MKNLSAAALAVLTDEVEVSGRELRISGQLDRKLYQEVNAALEALGGKWSRKQKAHVFESDPREAIEQVAVDGGFHDRKRDLDQFFTPADLARDVVARADVRGKSVLEPSAGQGAIVTHCLLAGARHVEAIELDPSLASSLRGNYLEDVVHVQQADFLTLDGSLSGEHEVDRVVMNPPFSGQLDILHVRTAFDWLKPGGLLVAIVSAGAHFRTDRKARAFRELVDRHGALEPLPERSFKESGTDVRTCLVTLRR